MKPQHLITTLAIAALALTGCGNNDEPQSREEAQQEYKDMLDSGEAKPAPPMPAGEYEASAEAGGSMIIDIPADPDNELITEIEKYREATGAEPVTYIAVDVDNRQGNDHISMHGVQLYDTDGTEYRFESATDLIEEWGPTYTSDYENVMPNGDVITLEEANELGDQERELADSMTGSVSAAGRDTIILVYEGTNIPEEFTRVAVQPGPFAEETDAYPTN